MRVLAGDIGGTSARFALFEDRDADGLSPVVSRTYQSAAFDGLEPLVREFLAELDGPPDAACLGVACPITDGVCRLPNLGWEVDARTFGDQIGLPGIRLINDFDAIGHGLARLGEEDVAELQEGRPDPDRTIAVVGAGTGLGVGYVTREGTVRRVHSSEGGHVDFAPRGPLEAELLAWLAETHGHVSYERVVSGPGLAAIYRFLRDTGRVPEREAVAREIEAGEAPEVISRHGLAGTDPLSRRALDAFVSVYGAQAGNVALLFQAEGGLYLAGGIAPAILDRLRDGPFMPAFLDKGRMTRLMERIPVRVILNERVGLLGAASAALGD